MIDRDDLSQAKTVIRGFLLKLGQSGLKRWQRRYFMIKSHFLLYWDNVNSAADADRLHPKATVDLDGIKEVKTASNLGIYITGNGFGHYELRAEHPDDHKLWLQVFQEALDEVTGRKSPKKGAAAS